MAEILTARLRLARFALADAPEVFACITPEVTRWMSWDPPSSEAFGTRAVALAAADPQVETNFVVRRRDTDECLGVVATERLGDDLPELGIWLKVESQGQGYGREAVEALLNWASATSGKPGFIYPVAVENTASRRIAERLGGSVIAERSGPKYDAVVYRIPARA